MGHPHGLTVSDACLGDCVKPECCKVAIWECGNAMGGANKKEKASSDPSCLLLVATGICLLVWDTVGIMSAARIAEMQWVVHG